ncbi:MAG: hypothetical protein Kow0077_31100 [Anaerolineae bacterium]
MTPRPEETLGRYHLDSLIGQGGMAQVFKAWDPNTQRHVAIKVLHQHLVDETNFKARFEREGKLIASLNHPNIVPLYDFDRQATPEGTVHYMVMPLIPGPTLKHRLEEYLAREECMPLDEVLRIIEGVAAALDYAHAKEMVHRDIKPGNILFSETGRPMLTDFGLARMTFGARLTESGVASGTPAYMAPEQGMGEPGDHRSDIYSLGIILYEMLTNNLPFLADTSLGILMKHINEPLPSPRSSRPDISPAVEAVVFRATAKDPDNRYQTAGELAAELRSAIEAEHISEQTRIISQPENRIPSGSAANRPTRSWLSYGLIAVILVIVGIVFGIAAFSGSAPAAPPPTATPQVNAMTAGPVPFSTDFEADNVYNEGWPIYEGGVFSTWIEDGKYWLRSEAQGQAHTAVYAPDYYEYTRLIVEARAILLPDSQPDSGYGLIFRYRDEDNFYVFAVNGRQQVSIWARENGEWRELRGGEDDWTVDEAVAPIGEPNLLSVLAVNDHITAYANGKRVIDIRDDTFDRGAVGVYIATTVRNVENVVTSVALENFSVTNAVPSMSG